MLQGVQIAIVLGDYANEAKLHTRTKVHEIVTNHWTKSITDIGPVLT